ncbi:hypothetical protein [Nocardia testacea]|uniref:hypothetical protein n=1 Tax=Nocardia testacea TaxID=248551 RepID=UPI003A84E025
MATDARRTLENPSATQLHDLLADMNLSAPFVIVDRLDGSKPGHHYIQVHLDERIDPALGHGYLVEYRDGGPDAHFRATVSDDAPWGSASSPAFDTVVTVVQHWAARRECWRTALAWERMDWDGTR